MQDPRDSREMLQELVVNVVEIDNHNDQVEGALNAVGAAVALDLAVQLPVNEVNRTENPNPDTTQPKI